MSKLTLAECGVGLFLSEAGELCFKAASDDGEIHAYVVGTGLPYRGAEPSSRLGTEIVRPLRPEDVLAGVSATLAAEQDSVWQPPDLNAAWRRMRLSDAEIRAALGILPTSK